MVNAKLQLSMKFHRSNPRASGFTLVELLCVIVIISILVAMLLPAISSSQARAKRIWCVSNFREIGIGAHAYMQDHNGKFPMQVPFSDGGSQEFVRNGYAVGGDFYFSFHHFQAMARELGTPKILICPTDTREAATRFSALQNENISYFVGVGADYNQPGSIFAGDRNISGISSSATILRPDSGSRLQWTAELHRYKGNMLFADGHVEQWNNTLLTDNSSALSGSTAFFLPTINPHRVSPVAVITTANPVANPRTSRLSQSINPAPRPAPSTMTVLNEHTVGDQKPMPPPNEVLRSPSPAPLLATASNAPVVEAAPAPADDMSAFDKHAVKYMQGILKWTYLLLLLLLLLLLAIEFLRRWQRRKNRAKYPRRSDPAA